MCDKNLLKSDNPTHTKTTSKNHTLCRIKGLILMLFNVNPKALPLSLIVSLLSITFLSSCVSPDIKSSEQELAIQAKTITNVSFEEVSLSKNLAEIKTMRVSPSVTLTYADNSSKTFPLSYKNLIRMGDKIGGGTFGMLVDVEGNPIRHKDGSVTINQHPDGNSFIQKGDKNYLITHMESHPGAIYKTELCVEDGQLKAIDTEPVDLSKTAGTIINCASTKTPWNTHLGGEEDYSLNGIFADSNSPFYMQCEIKDRVYTGAIVEGKQTYYCKYIQSMQKFLNDPDIDRNNGYNGKIFSPYNYGYTLEVSINEDGSTEAARHYVTGKYTPELGIVMPDNKTVYMTDDGTAKGFWKFVSDEKITAFNNNWEGSLFAAKVKQLSNKNGGEFSINWIKLGHASDNQIKKLVDTKLKITDIFNVEKPKNKICKAGFKLIYEDSMLECLRLIPGQEFAAAYLESRKYAAYLGATMEFRKEEGITYSATNNKLYVSMSRIDKSMEDNYKGIETTNHIRLPANICGGVYELALDDSYSANHMQALITGTPLSPDDKHADENYCDPESIANPDNITVMGSNILVISEDSVLHVNNMSWAYHLKTKQLTRIASLPFGAEITGVANVKIDGKGFMILTQQHPFMDNPRDRSGNKIFPELIENASAEELTATIGYFDGIPVGVFED
jgi:hypothetical protein